MKAPIARATIAKSTASTPSPPPRLVGSPASPPRCSQDMPNPLCLPATIVAEERVPRARRLRPSRRRSSAHRSPLRPMPCASRRGCCRTRRRRRIAPQSTHTAAMSSPVAASSPAHRAVAHRLRHSGRDPRLRRAPGELAVLVASDLGLVHEQRERPHRESGADHAHERRVAGARAWRAPSPTPSRPRCPRAPSTVFTCAAFAPSPAKPSPNCVCVAALTAAVRTAPS